MAKVDTVPQMRADCERSDLDGFVGTLSIQRQRELLGGAFFGKSVVYVQVEGDMARVKAWDESLAKFKPPSHMELRRAGSAEERKRISHPWWERQTLPPVDPWCEADIPLPEFSARMPVEKKTRQRKAKTPAAPPVTQSVNGLEQAKQEALAKGFKPPHYAIVGGEFVRVL